MKSPLKPLRLSISKSGTITAIYDDALAPLMAEGKAITQRASHVEPAPEGGWSATMYDGIVLGPYTLRQEALDAEVKYLEEKLFSE